MVLPFPPFVAGYIVGGWFRAVGAVFLEGSYLCLEAFDLGLLGSELLALSRKVLPKYKFVDRQLQDIAYQAWLREAFEPMLAGDCVRYTCRICTF